MDEQTPSLAAEIETVKEYYAAVNRNDIPAAMKFFDPQAEWTEPPKYPLGTLCAYDLTPRQVSVAQLQHVRTLAEAAVAMLRQRRLDMA